jgi:hypothetical protein
MFSECCHYSRHYICALFSSHRITPYALYRCYASFARDSDNLYRKLLISFLTEHDIFVTINTHTHTHTHIGALFSVVDKAACYLPEGRGFETRWSE